MKGLGRRFGSSVSISWMRWLWELELEELFVELGDGLKMLLQRFK